jgi:hypothetical protein
MKPSRCSSCDLSPAQCKCIGICGLPTQRKREQASLSSRVKIKDRQTGKVLHEEEERDNFKVSIPKGKSVGYVRDVMGITLSLDFNSATVQVGVEMPVPVTAGSYSEMSNMMDKVEKLVGRKMEKKARDVRLLLRELSGSTKKSR